MNTCLQPVYFKSANMQEFNEQLKILTSLLDKEAYFLEPVPLGSEIPADADAVVFPQLVGEAYREVHEMKKITLPILIITSEFGTVAMWDWEIITFLRSERLKPFAPYDLKMTKAICRALSLKRDMLTSKFLVFQDNPGEGMQASIFKRFFWWEEECVRRMKEKFGIEIVKKSFKKLASDAKALPDDEARAVLKQWDIPAEGVTLRAFNSAVKMYMAVKNELLQDERIKGVGTNCLNESAFSDTTPCMTWNMLYEEMGIMWACEGDILSLLSKYLIHKTTQAPTVMSNLYPFLMGETATKHERIDRFPDIENFDNHILVGHCGYFACMPKSFATDWTLKPKVLGIVDDNATAIDARYPIGDVTIAQLHPTLGKLLVIEGTLKEYIQYPGSDCRNGALIEVSDGRKLMSSMYSHHGIIIPGHLKTELEVMSNVMNIELEVL